jgi:hypothetical protein
MVRDFGGLIVISRDVLIGRFVRILCDTARACGLLVRMRTSCDAQKGHRSGRLIASPNGTMEQRRQGLSQSLTHIWMRHQKRTDLHRIRTTFTSRREKSGETRDRPADSMTAEHSTAPGRHRGDDGSSRAPVLMRPVIAPGSGTRVGSRSRARYGTRPIRSPAMAEPTAARDRPTRLRTSSSIPLTRPPPHGGLKCTLQSSCRLQIPVF